MSISREQALMIEQLKDGGASDATIGAIMLLLSTDEKIAALAEELRNHPSANEDEIFMLAVCVARVA